MKKLGKLQISSEKIIRNEELLALRGGYDTTIKCYREGWIEGCYGYLGSVTGNCDNWRDECKKGGYTAGCVEC
jgi:hypothetical protein